MAGSNINIHLSNEVTGGIRNGNAKKEMVQDQKPEKADSLENHHTFRAWNLFESGMSGSCTPASRMSKVPYLQGSHGSLRTSGYYDKVKPVRIAVDAMGGDYAPEEIVRGCVDAAEKFESEAVEVLLCGSRDVIDRCLEGEKNGSSDCKKRGDIVESRLSVVNAEKTVAMGDNPLKRARGSSMEVGLKLVKSGNADAFISAGNTGAAMVLSTLILGRVGKLERPAIATTIPVREGRYGKILLIDSGANVDCRPEHLVDFARMGCAYGASVHGMSAPRVGLLNIGGEQGKGDALTKAAWQLLSDSACSAADGAEAGHGIFDFTGNVEGGRLFSDVCDIVVCDGFVGNVILKTLEGFAAQLIGWNYEAMIEAGVGKERMERAVAGMKKKLDYREYGGAPLLGLNGVSIICHGSSNRVAMLNAVRTAVEAVRKDFVGAVRGALPGGL